MGTRNLTIVKQNKTLKVAQYCQWDGYPTGQGETISEFLRKKANIKNLKANIDKVKFIEEKELDVLWKGVGIDSSGLVSMDISDKFKNKYPELHRDTGAKVLELIAKGKATKLQNEVDFLKDGLFCEYAYEIELDKETVTLYVGGEKYKTYTFKEFAKKGKMKEIESEINKD